MKFVWGSIFAVLGSLVGVVLALFIVTTFSNENDLFVGFGAMFLGPVGLLTGTTLGIIFAWRVRCSLRANASGHSIASIAGVTAIIALLLVAAMFWGIRSVHTPPSDRRLIQNFERNRPTFEELARMVKTDEPLLRVGTDWIDPSEPKAVGVSAERINAYRRLLERANLQFGIQSEERKTGIKFLSWIKGSAITSDTCKGYAYLPAPPRSVWSNLDECQPNEQDGVEAYRHIEGHWYLYYGYIP